MQKILSLCRLPHGRGILLAELNKQEPKVPHLEEFRGSWSDIVVLLQLVLGHLRRVQRSGGVLLARNLTDGTSSVQVNQNPYSGAVFKRIGVPQTLSRYFP